MNKLIKFISLITILSSNLSLFAMEQEPLVQEDLQTQTHLWAKVYVGTPLELFSGTVSRAGDRILVNFTNPENAMPQCKVLVDSKAYNLMESRLSLELLESKCLFSKLNLTNLAAKFVREFDDKIKLKEFTTTILPALYSQYICSFEYAASFFLAITMLSHNGTCILCDAKELQLFDELRKLNKEIFSLVKLAMLIRLKCYSPTDCLNGLQDTFSLTLLPKDEIDQRIITEIDDSFVAANTIVVSYLLLSSIKSSMESL